MPNKRRKARQSGGRDESNTGRAGAALATFENVRPAAAAALPLAFTSALIAISRTHFVAGNSRLVWSFTGAAGVLAGWAVLFAVIAFARNRRMRLDVVLRPQHYLQACAQGSVLLYWGWYWRPVYENAPLLLAQLLFAYAFDILLTWSREDTYVLGFAPFPVIFSINLFLWFRSDWFYWQFAMIAVGFCAKALIRWDRDGRRSHIFNPSSFPLGIFSLVLILTRSTDMTWGKEIASTQFLPPYIYVWLFAIGLPGQLLFGVTTMTMSAVLCVYGFGLAYFAFTGTYFFFDSYIPIAVFLGMHLLFTDPSTSPRTELGRVIFGVAYGLAVVGFYALLGLLGVPTFYDKLLPVPILNVMVGLIDRFARSPMMQWVNPARLGAALIGRRRNLAYVAIWIVVFGAMSAAHGVGDNHRGQSMAFWQRACDEGRRSACENASLMASQHCENGSAWACNEQGVRLTVQPGQGRETAIRFFQRACALGAAAGCENARLVYGQRTGPPVRYAPQLRDYQLLLRYGKGPLSDRTPYDLYRRACDQEWLSGCEGLAFALLRGAGTARDPDRAVNEFDKACRAGLASACSNVGYMYRIGDGVPHDDARAVSYLKKACEFGMTEACRWLNDQGKRSQASSGAP